MSAEPWIRKLQRPIPRLDGEGTVTAVTLLRDYCTAGDIMACKRSGDDAWRQDMVLVGRLFGLDVAEVEDLDLRDFYALQARATEVLASAHPEPEAPPDPKS